MLAESVMDWTRQWKQEGLEEGRKKGREEIRRTLLQNLETRFGPLSDEVRQRVEAIGSIQDLAELGFRAGTASSLRELGLS